MTTAGTNNLAEAAATPTLPAPPPLTPGSEEAPSPALTSRDREPMLAQTQTDPLSPALTSCDREPIHTPGSIQPHGFLLALDEGDRIAVASQSTEHFLNRPAAALFGQTLPQLFGESLGSQLLRECLAEPLGPSTRLLTPVGITPLQLTLIQLPGQGGPQHFEVVAYRTGAGGASRTVLEFEHTPRPADIERINARLYNFVSATRSLSTVEEICQAATHELHALTGCGRVVLYRFDEAGHGLVLSQVLTNPRFDSYLGLRFPATDVPVQARRMYLSNRVRIIPDVNYEPSPLLAPGDADAPAAELDLSPSILRSLSPVHREYMRNMGTVCSMSVSIIIDGKLWGLVSCHHHEPRFVPIRLRSACDFVMQIAASQIESLLAANRLKRALAAKAVQARLLAAMASQDSYMDGLTGSPDLLCELAGADGVAVVQGLAATLSGITPSQEQVLALTDWLRRHHVPSAPGVGEIFSTHTLAAVYPPAAAFTPAIAGFLAMPVSRLHNSHVLWFRQEIVETVRWAGNPEKSAQSQTEAPPPEPPSSARGPESAQSQNNAPSTDPPSSARGPESAQSATTISPRHSFAEWQQILRGASEPWSPEVLAATEEFRAATLSIVLGRAEALAELASGLQVANEELEAFSYSVSHDLRAPFRHISGFAEMLREEEGSRMSDRGRQYLATIMESARFAGLLVDSLLEFSRFARAKIHLVPVNMEELVDREWQAVLAAEAAGRSVDFARDPLPRVMGDPQLLRQVLRNLFSNALKYSSRQPKSRIRITVRVEAQEYVFSVTDNGVGFDGEFAGKLFGVFQRLHRVEDFEGTGIGLANVRRIIGRHGGRTWAEGKVGEGASFFFTLPTTFPPETSGAL